MLTGKPAFTARNVADTLALVLTSEPSWEALPSDTPPLVRARYARW